jgi:hypothetical protein
MGEPAKRFQQRLGDLHDLDVAIEVVGKSKLAPATRSRVLRALRTERASQVRRYLADAAPTIATEAPVPAVAPTPAATPAAHDVVVRPVSTRANARPKATAAMPVARARTPRRRKPRVLWRGTLSRP